MFDILYIISVIAVMVGIVGWGLFWSPMARSTKELHHLNRIWEQFNDSGDIVATQKLLNERVWRFHTKEVGLLEDVIRMVEK